MLVYQVLADMEAYPEFVNDLISVTRDGNLYKFVARVAILTVSATLAVTETPGRSIAFELIDGPVDVLTGSWLIEAGRTPEQTQVTLTIHVETQARGEWLLRMTSKFVQSKTDKLITAFSNRVIELQRTGVTPPAPAPQESGFVAWFKNLWTRLFGQPYPTIAKISPLRQVWNKLRRNHLFSGTNIMFKLWKHWPQR